MLKTAQLCTHCCFSLETLSEKKFATPNAVESVVEGCYVLQK